MALSKIDYIINKVIQATHLKGDITYGSCRVMQCPCISLISVSWILFQYPGLWDEFDLDCLLGTRGQINLDILRLTARVFDKKILHKCGICRK